MSTIVRHITTVSGGTLTPEEAQSCIDEVVVHCEDLGLGL